MSNSLLEILAGKTEEVEVDYHGIKIVFRTLSQKEYNEIQESNPRVDVIGLELNKVPVLARAIVSIDGKKLESFREIEEQDNKLTTIQKKEKFLGSMDAIVVDELFNVYAEEREKILKKKTQLKKNN